MLRLFLLSLCALIIFAPRIHESAQVHQSALTLSTTGENYTFLAVPPRSGGDSHRVRNSQGDTYRRALQTATAVASPGAQGYLAANAGVISFRVNLFDSIRQSFRQICQLLDIPPPSDTVS